MLIGHAVRIADDEAAAAPWTIRRLADDLVAGCRRTLVEAVDRAHLEADEQRLGVDARPIGKVDELDARRAAGREDGAVAGIGPFLDDLQADDVAVERERGVERAGRDDHDELVDARAASLTSRAPSIERTPQRLGVTGDPR